MPIKVDLEKQLEKKNKITESLEALKTFINTCISSSNSIHVDTCTYEQSIPSYNLFNEKQCLQFLKEHVFGNVVGICEAKHLHYNEKLPVVHEYIFTYIQEDGSYGCLAFYKNQNVLP